MLTGKSVFFGSRLFGGVATLRQKRAPLPMVKWVNSFLSDRQTAMCLDGRQGDLLPIATVTGLPQGSPVSPPLSSIYTASLSEKISQGMDLSQLGPNLARRARRGKATLTNMILYVDDSKLTVASDSITTNVLLLARAYQIVEAWMAEHGLRIDPAKSELIHHTWRNGDRKSINDQPPTINTPVMVPATTTRPEIVTTPAKMVKWLRVTFDTKLKLTFLSHLKNVSTQATDAVNSLSMLGNSIRGLHQVYRRHLIQGAILPMMLYASVAWWNGQKTQTNIIEKVQNKGLRYITGAFCTTPTYAMQIEAAIPPIALTLDYIVERKANAAQHFSARHPVTHHLPAQHRSNNIQESDSLPFPEPHKQIGAHTSPANRIVRETKNAKCTAIYKIGQHMLRNTESIDKALEALWHRVDDRVKISIPKTLPEKSQKKHWAKRHKRLICQIKMKPEEMTVYTDGSLWHEHGTRLTGAGIVAFREGDAIFQEQMALGGCSEVYDAEMEGLARGAEATRDWIQRAGADHGVRHIRFFADNTGAIQCIYKGTPGLDQACSR